MSDIRWLLRTSRPRFWLYIFGPYLVGIAAAVHTDTSRIDLLMVVFALYFLFPANLLVYGVNDIFDFETDRVNAKKRAYEIALLPDFRRKLAAFIVFTSLPFLLVAVFLSLNSFIIFSVFLLLSIFYSAPPVRAKAIPIVDSLFNVLYVIPGLFAYYLASGHLPPFRIIAAASFWTVAMHAYSAIPDIQADKESGIATVATLLRPTGTLIFCAVAFISAAVLLFPSFPAAAVVLCAIYILMIALSFGFQTRIFSFYRLFPVINAVCGFILFWTAAFSH